MPPILSKKVNAGKECFERSRIYRTLVNSSRKQLDALLAGLMPRLDWHFYRTMRKSFVEALFENPEEALKQLMDFYGADSVEELGEAKYVLYTCLKTFFLSCASYYEKAYRALISCDWAAFGRLVEKFIKELKPSYLESAVEGSA